MTEGDSPNYDIIKKERAERKARYSIHNMEILKACGFPYQERNNNTILLFRVPGKPAVDFYPTRNKWRVLENKPFNAFGNAEKFLAWFRKQNRPIQETIPGVRQSLYVKWADVKTEAIKTKKTIQPVPGGWILK